MLKRHRKLIIWLAVAIVGCLAIAYSLFLADYYIGFNAPSKPSFAGYKPTYLPNTIKVRGQALTRFHIAGTDQWSFNYELELSSQDFTLFENQKDTNEPSQVSCQSYGGICTIYHTPQGHAYRVWYSVYNGQPSELQIDSIIGNTDITMFVNSHAAPKYLPYDWSPVFDSMQKVDLSQLRFKQLNSTNSGG